MTIYPFQLYEVMHLYGRVSKLKSPSLIEKSEDQEPQDVVNISSEAKKKQIIEETKKEVLQKVRQ